jgi:hypothetical protein
MKAELTGEHAFLQKLVGHWEMIGDTADSEQTWRETVRSLHGVWFLAEGKGKMPDGAEGSSLLTLGYDPARRNFVGSWIGSMMNHFWVYEGALEADGSALLLDTTGPDFENAGKTARYRERLAFEDDDNRTFSSHLMTPEGSWRQFMLARYRRIG